ncbi:hypothetical protein [Streptomyces sp. 2231.1]|nr:hypothetical protein [Streptomyces sp. 2231.1]
MAGVWAGAPAEVAVINARERAHSIVEYLAHPEVAGEIGGHLQPR